MGTRLVLIIMDMLDMLMISIYYVPGLKGLQRMLNICNTFSCSNVLIFNTTKSMCIHFHYGKYNGEITQYPV